MQRYEFSDGKSNKFWQIEQAGAELHIAWGKIGTAGQSQVKAFDSEAKAAAAKAKLIAEKTGKGYVAEGGAAAPALPPAPVAAQAAADAAAGDVALATAAASSAVKAKARKAPAKAKDADADEGDGDEAPASDEGIAPAAATQTAPAADALPDTSAEPASSPATPTEAINAWLAARRAQPGVDRLALAAWRQLLAVAEAEPELWQASTLSPWQKRFGVDAKAAALMMEWRGNWLDATGPAADWLADAHWLKLDAELQTANDLAWAPLLPDEPAKAAEPQDPVPLNGKRRSEAAPAGAGARFGQALPTVLASPTPAPVVGDTAAAAWEALLALWQPQALPKVAESEAAFAEVIAQTEQRLAGAGQLDGVEAPAQADCFESNRLLLAVALCLGDGELSLSRFNAKVRKEENQRLNMRALASQLWHWLRLSHSLPERQALLMAALGTQVDVLQGLGRGLYVKASNYIGLLPENLVLDFMRQDLAAASETDAAICQAQLQAADLKPDALPVMAWVWRDRADLSAWAMDKLKTRSSRCTTWHWLMPLAREADVLEALQATLEKFHSHQHYYHWQGLAVAQQQTHGATLIPMLAARMAEYNPPSRHLARINHPDALLVLMRHSDTSKEIQGHMQLAMARWPLAALAAAAQLAQQAQGSGKHAALGQGLVRQLLPEVGPALALLQPWLSTTVWRWLQQLAQADQHVTLATPEALAEQVPVLVNPPWLKKKKASAGSALKLAPPALPDALDDWPAEEKSELLANLRHLLKHGVSAEKNARDLNMDRWQNKHSAAMAEWARAIAAGDAAGLISSWQAELARVRQQRGSDWQPYLWGSDLAQLPPELGLPFWNQLATSVDFYVPEAVLAHWGLPAMPGMLAFALQRPASVAEFAHRLGSVQLAPWAARHAFASKQPAMRALGRRWLRAWPDHAAAGLIATAISGTGAEQGTAAQALRWLRAQPETQHGQLLLDVAARFDDPAVPAALQAVLDQDPIEQFPAKFAKSMPDFWQPQAWSRPQLNGGGALPDEALLALGQMLSFGRPDGVYAGLTLVQAACTPTSLGAYAWDLFSAWLAAGAPAKDNWAYTALGVLGDEVCVQRLRPLMATWPNEGASARASLGLQILCELGTEAALRIVADVAERDKPKGLQAKAQEMLTGVAAARGLSLEDLQDRLVPTMGLDARAQTTLDYGPRQFLLALDENLKPFLRKLENGKPGARLKAVATKNAADDPAMAQAAIERFKAIKAQAEGVAKVQLRRFEQAMVSGRRWSRADFELLYVRQPLMRQLASRLVWGVFERVAGDEAAGARAANVRQQPERLHQLVRLSDDSGLTTAEDEGWDWPEDAPGLEQIEANASADTGADSGADEASESASRWRIGIAHPLEMDEQSLANFGQLLADYELMQPFEQLGRPGARLPEAGVDLQAQRSAQIADFMARKDGYSPRRLLGLKSRGWALTTDSGYEWHGATRELGEGCTVALQLSPGVSVYELKTAPPQTLSWLRVGKGQGEVSWGDLDAISYSELVRDLNYLLL